MRAFNIVALARIKIEDGFADEASSLTWQERYSDALASNYPDVLKAAIRHGINPDNPKISIRNFWNTYHEHTAPDFCAAMKYNRMLKIVLDANPDRDPATLEKAGKSAAQSNNIEGLKLLFAAGLEPTEGLLDTAVEHCRRKIVNFLLFTTGDAYHRQDEAGESAIDRALKKAGLKNFPEIVQSLEGALALKGYDDSRPKKLLPMRMSRVNTAMQAIALLNDAERAEVFMRAAKKYGQAQIEGAHYPRPPAGNQLTTQRLEK